MSPRPPKKNRGLLHSPNRQHKGRPHPVFRAGAKEGVTSARPDPLAAPRSIRTESSNHAPPDRFLGNPQLPALSRYREKMIPQLPLSLVVRSFLPPERIKPQLRPPQPPTQKDEIPGPPTRPPHCPPGTPLTQD